MKLTEQIYNEESSKLLKKLQNVFAAKNHDYGSSFTDTLDMVGPVAAATRIYDKAKRFLNLSVSTNPHVDESIEDTLEDIINYAIMTRICMKNCGAACNGSDHDIDKSSLGMVHIEAPCIPDQRIIIGNWYRVFTPNDIANNRTMSNVIGKLIDVNKDGSCRFIKVQYCKDCKGHSKGEIFGKWGTMIVPAENVRYIVAYDDESPEDEMIEYHE